MKYIIGLVFILILSAQNIMAADTYKTNDVRIRTIHPDKVKMDEQRRVNEKEFEQKLGLSELQIKKARKLREEGFTKIKPVMDELHQKRQEALIIKNSDLSNEMKEEKLSVLDREIQELHRKAAEIRKQNMKDFESILDKNQRNILNNMKKEGRENFQRVHRLPPPEGERKIPPAPRYMQNK